MEVGRAVLVGAGSEPQAAERVKPRMAAITDSATGFRKTRHFVAANGTLSIMKPFPIELRRAGSQVARTAKVASYWYTHPSMTEAVSFAV